MSEPNCLAMVLCDAIHRDAATGKFTLLGTFTTLQSPHYPADIQFAVYFAVTDGNGVVPMRLKIVDARSNLEGQNEAADIFCSPAEEINFVTPLAIIEAAALIRTRLPSPGLYHCELYAGDELLMSRRIVAMPAAPPPSEAR